MGRRQTGCLPRTEGAAACAVVKAWTWVVDSAPTCAVVSPLMPEVDRPAS